MARKRKKKSRNIFPIYLQRNNIYKRALRKIENYLLLQKQNFAGARIDLPSVRIHFSPIVNLLKCFERLQLCIRICDESQCTCQPLSMLPNGHTNSLSGCYDKIGHSKLGFKILSSLHRTFGRPKHFLGTRNLQKFQFQQISQSCIRFHIHFTLKRLQLSPTFYRCVNQIPPLNSNPATKFLNTTTTIQFFKIYQFIILFKNGHSK